MSYVYHALYAYFSRDNVGLPGFAAYFKVRRLWVWVSPPISTQTSPLRLAGRRSTLLQCNSILNPLITSPFH